MFPVISLAGFVIRVQPEMARSSLSVARLQTSLAPPPGEPLPDVYYIILDGYARSDYMDSIFGYDNSEFLKFLRARGFYVAEQSHSNHNWTGLSLSSSLNMVFAQDLGLEFLPHSYPAVVVPAIRHSLVRNALEEIGYQTVAMSSGYVPTEILDADLYLAPSELDLRALSGPITPNRFEAQLLRTTAFLAVSDRWGGLSWNWVGEFEDFPHEELRQTVLSAFANLPVPASDPRPQFVFAHILSPHPPYLFDARGGPIDPEQAFTFAENTTGDATPEENAAYREQASFITDQMTQVIDQILQASPTPPIILLQADHGSGAGQDWESIEAAGVPQRTAILNAYLLPERCRGMLYPSITPVNSFRVLFNCQFGTSLPLLPDQVFYTLTPREDASNFKNVTNLVASPEG
jgi:hypothetical protein